jgi:predicted GNAT family acetyltransferase
MAVEVTDNQDGSRFEIRTDGELAGFAAYKRKPDLISFSHTEIDDRFEGQGLGSKLVKAALEAARSEGLGVLPFCPFVRSYIERHPDEYLELVPEDQRERFRL